MGKEAIGHSNPLPQMTRITQMALIYLGSKSQDGPDV